MTKSSWARTSRKVAPATIAPAAWELAVERARQAWIDLTGDRGPYDGGAASAILDTALRLLPSTAALVAEGGQDGP